MSHKEFVGGGIKMDNIGRNIYCIVKYCVVYKGRKNDQMETLVSIILIPF